MRPVRYIALGILAAALQICFSNKQLMEEAGTLHSITAETLTELWCDLSSFELKSGKRQIEIDRSDPYMMGYSAWSMENKKDKQVREVKVEDMVLSYSPENTSATQEGSN